MINFLNRKNLLALLLALTCVGPQAAWGMRARSGSVDTINPAADRPTIKTMEDGDRPAKIVTVDNKVVDTITKEPASYFSEAYLVTLRPGQVVSMIENGKITNQTTRTAKGFTVKELQFENNKYITTDQQFEPEVIEAEYARQIKEEEDLLFKNIDADIFSADSTAEARLAQAETARVAEAARLAQAETARVAEAARLAQAAREAWKIKQGRLSTAEVGTAAGRMIAITVTQHMKNKFGKDSKKALIAEVFANVLRIANDVTMLSNERVNDRKYLLNWATLSCSAIDACNIAVNAKKLAKKEFVNKQIDDEPKQVSKLINFINSYVPYIEGLAALVRSGAKTEKLGNHTDIAYGCTLFITFARAAEFYATAEDSKSIKALAFGVAAVAVLTTIWDLIPSKKDKAIA